MLFDNLYPEEFKDAFESTENAILLDVRTPKEAAAGKIEVAQNIDFYAPDFDEKIAELDKSKKYFLHCRSGNRSAQACGKMMDMGFEVTNLTGAGYDDLALIW